MVKRDVKEIVSFDKRDVDDSFVFDDSFVKRVVEEMISFVKQRPKKVREVSKTCLTTEISKRSSLLTKETSTTLVCEVRETCLTTEISKRSSLLTKETSFDKRDVDDSCV